MSVQATAPDDTAANGGGGQLTPEQQRLLAAAVHHETAPNIVGVGCFSFLFALIFFASLNPDRPGPNTSPALIFGELFALTLLLMVVLIWRRQRLLAEVQAGRLEHGAGHVEWKGGRYRAQVAGRSLDVTALNLGTGTYDFDFLPRSGRVVAARLAAADTPTQAQDELRHALAVTNHFNVDDLPSFREGRLGPGTFRRLRQVWSTAGWLLLGAFVLLVIFVFIVNADGSQELAPMMFVFAIFLALGALGAAVGAIGRTRDVLGGRVAQAAGTVVHVKRETYGRGAHIYYYYQLGEQQWLVSPEAARALINGLQYRVYYLPHSKTMVGIEPI